MDGHLISNSASPHAMHLKLVRTLIPNPHNTITPQGSKNKKKKKKRLKY